MRKKIPQSPAEIRDPDIRVRCIVGHEIPLGNGRFTVFEKGKIYILKDYSPAFFEPVIPTINESEVSDHASE